MGGTKEIERAGWYVLHVRSNQERRARDYLDSRGIETFLPLFREASRRRDRQAVVEKPLFKGYLFLRSSLARSERIEILHAPGAVRVVGFGGSPAIVDCDLVESVRTLAGAGRDPMPFPYLERGMHVRVAGGPLAGLAGFLVEAPEGKQKVVISVQLLGRSVAATIEREEVVCVGN